MDLSITRTPNEFRSSLTVWMRQEGISFEKAAEILGLNLWHISNFVNDPSWEPSRRICRLLNIRKRPPAKRVIIYAGSDMTEKDQQIRKLTNGQYALVKLEAK